MGTAKQPIVVRVVEEERATIVTPTGNPNAALVIRGDYSWFWGLEFTSTSMDTATVNAAAVFVGGIAGQMATGNKLINCIIHDATGNGMGDQTDAEGTEVSGCLIYYNGRKTDNRNYAYGIYGQNGGSSKVYRDNVVMFNYGGYAFHMYTESGTVDSIRLSHNIVFSTSGGSANMMFSEASGSAGIIVDTNYFWGSSPEHLLYQERKAMLSPILRGNYFMNGRVSFRESTTGRLFFGNVLYGARPQLTSSGREAGLVSESDLVGNVLLDPAATKTRPRQQQVVVRPNPYEKGRGHIVVYNWTMADSVRVDLSRVVPPGWDYVVRDVQDYYGDPLATGNASSYVGTTLSLRGWRVPVPVSVPAAKRAFLHTGKEFGAFVVESRPPRR
jgi:hypothetical protein